MNRIFRHRLGIATKLTVISSLLLSLASCIENEIPKLELVEVFGLVAESSSNQPIAGAGVSIVDQEIDDQLTGNDGTFKFSGLRLDDATYELEISHPDYANTKTVFTISNGKLTDEISALLIASEALSFDNNKLDFGSGTNELLLEVTNNSTTSKNVTLKFSADWIDSDISAFSLASGDSKQVAFTVDRSALQVGDFETNVVFEIEGRNNQSLTATLQKPDPTSGILKIVSTSLDFGKASESKTLKLENIGQSSLNWTVIPGESWLTMSDPSGAISPGQNQLIAVNVDRTELENGNYSATLAFDGSGGTATVTVNMEVDNSVGILKVDVSGIDFGKELQTSDLVITNDGTSDLSWTAGSEQPWLSLSSTSGDLTPGTNSTITITVDRLPLDAGVHTGSVDFEAGGETTSVNIALEVEGGVLQISTTSLDFASSESNLTAVITNVGSRILNWTASENQPWLSLSQSDGMLDPEGELTLSVTVDRIGLELGAYSGTISLGGDGGEATIAIAMTVELDDDGDGVANIIDADDDNDGLIEIYTINDLDNVRNDLQALGTNLQGAPGGGFTGYELVNDLDFENDNDYDDLSLKPQVTSGSLGWTSIGTNSSNSFATTFEGNDFTIHNLFINNSTDYNGIFGYTNILSDIKNLKVNIKFLSGDQYTAGLIGYNKGKVTNCTVSGSATVGNDSGLLIGKNEEGVVASCFTEGSITAKSGFDYIGGLIGAIGGSSSDINTISFCYSTASVNGDFAVGGLIGGSSSGTHTVNSCYARGNVTSSGERAGGLIGFSSNSGLLISSCYATGDVTSSNRYIGGLIGWSNNGQNIITSYSIGTVIGTNNVGGFAGRASSISSTNYWDTQTSGLATSSGGASGLTTTQLQGPTSNIGIYIAWSSDLWDFGTSGEYPVLKNMPNGLAPQRN